MDLYSSALTACPTCGQQNPEQARFCSACGSALGYVPEAREERKVVSVLFVDLVGFTSRSDRADPEDVRDLLKEYHRQVKDQIQRFGGRWRSSSATPSWPCSGLRSPTPTTPSAPFGPACAPSSPSRS